MCVYFFLDHPLNTDVISTKVLIHVLIYTSLQLNCNAALKFLIIYLLCLCVCVCLCNFHKLQRQGSSNRPLEHFRDHLLTELWWPSWMIDDTDDFGNLDDWWLWCRWQLWRLWRLWPKDFRDSIKVQCSLVSKSHFKLDSWLIDEKIY